MFDYGAHLNIKAYGRIEPPEYSLKKVKVPVFIIWAQNDYISHPKVSNYFKSQFVSIVLSIIYCYIKHIYG